MDTVTAVVLIVALVSLVLVGFFAVFRFRGRFKLWGPFGVRAEAEGANEPSPGVRGKDLVARHGGLTARDESGQGVDVEKVRVAGNIDLSTKDSERDRHPKP